MAERLIPLKKDGTNKRVCDGAEIKVFYSADRSDFDIGYMVMVEEHEDRLILENYEGRIVRIRLDTIWNVTLR